MMTKLPKDRYAPGTLGYLVDDGYRLRFYCDTFGCKNEGEIDLVAFCEWLGPEHGAMKRDLEPLYRCPLCGGRKVNLSLSPPCPAAPDRIACPDPRSAPRAEGPSYREQKRARRKRK